MFNFFSNDSTYENISVNEAVTILDERPNDVLMLDVRTPEEFQQGNVEGSKLLPLQVFAQKIQALDEYKDKEVLIICRSGSRSGVAASYLSKSGFSKVKNISGGLMSWYQSGYPIVPGSSTEILKGIGSFSRQDTVTASV